MFTNIEKLTYLDLKNNLIYLFYFIYTLECNTLHKYYKP